MTLLELVFIQRDCPHRTRWLNIYHMNLLNAENKAIFESEVRPLTDKEVTALRVRTKNIGPCAVGWLRGLVI